MMNNSVNVVVAVIYFVITVYGRLNDDICGYTEWHFKYFSAVVMLVIGR